MQVPTRRQDTSTAIDTTALASGNLPEKQVLTASDRLLARRMPAIETALRAARTMAQAKGPEERPGEPSGPIGGT